MTSVVDDKGVELECYRDNVNNGVEEGRRELRLQVDARFAGLSFMTFVYETHYRVEMYAEL